MSNMRYGLPILAAAMGLSTSTVAFGQLVQRVENFNTEPADWQGQNNRSATQDFGFSPTNNTVLGATGAGEAGGTIRRFGPSTVSETVFYATDVGTLTSNDPLIFSGILSAERNAGATQFGFFNSATPGAGGAPQNFLGFFLDGDQNPEFTAFDVYVQATGNKANPLEEASRNRTLVYNNLPGGGEDYSFTLTYDPASSLATLQFVDGTGTPIVPFGGVGANTVSTSGLTGVSYDRFGFGPIPAGGSSDILFFDDLTYTSTIIPEPASLGLLGVSGLMLRRRRSA